MAEQAHPTGLTYMLTGLLAFMSLLDLTYGNYSAAGRGVLLGAAMGIIAATGGHPRRGGSIAIVALIGTALGVGIYTWMG